MNKRSIICCLSLLALALPQFIQATVIQATGGSGASESSTAGAAGSASKPSPEAQHNILANYGKVPLSFEANQGQTDSRVKFMSRGSGYTLFLTGNEAVLGLRKKPEVRSRKSEKSPHSSVVGAAGSQQSGTNDKGPRAKDSVLTMKLVGANANATTSGADELPGRSNYFIGNDPRKWHNNVPTYAKVRYQNVYPGVDLVYYGNQGQLEYDFVVAPGANPDVIRLDVGALVAAPGRHGASRRESAGTGSQQRAQQATPLRLDANGDLVVKLDGSELRFHKPVIYQPATPNSEPRTEKLPVEGRYRLAGDQVTFEVANYDRTRPLVIDPTLTYSTYLGGSSVDQGNGIAVDSSGDAYVTGYTVSTNFPVTPGVFQGVLAGSEDAFVTKLNPQGSAAIYSTYLGGGSDVAQGIAIDAAGDAYITGSTASTNFPVTPGAFQQRLAGVENAFVTELNSTGSALIYSTYLGGSSFDSGLGIAINGSGNAYVSGETTSVNFPNTPGAFQNACAGTSCDDAFITELSSGGSALVYSTFLGGSSSDRAYGIALNSSGDAYVTGFTESTNFPNTPGAFQTTCLGTCGDAFVTELNSSGSALVYSTYLGGTGGFNLYGGFGAGIAVDSAGDSYVTGYTYASDFPTTPGVVGQSCAACVYQAPDPFVTVFNPAGSAPVYSTFLGAVLVLCSRFGCGGEGTTAASIAVDPAGNAYITGHTPGGLPVTGGAFEPKCQGMGNGDPACNASFMTEFNNTGTSLVYSTYMGGMGGATGTGIAVNSAGNVYMTGQTGSAYPVTQGAFQTTYQGGEDAYVSNFTPSPYAILAPTSLSYALQAVGTTSPPQSVTLTNTGNLTLNITSISITGTNHTDFAETNNCGSSLAGSASCTINVTFTPTAEGTRTADVSVADNGPASPQKVTLTGVATASGVMLSPASLTFPNQLVFTTSSVQAVTLTNVGSGTLTITSIAISGNFAETNTCGSSVLAGASCTISVTFTPQSAGTLTGSITVTDNAINSPQSVSLTGTGTEVQLVPSSLNFGNINVGSTSPPQAISMTNKGTTTVSITSIKITGTNVGDFAETNNCGSNLTPGEICTINVTFAPATEGTLAADVTVSDSDPGSPQTVALSGNGTTGQGNPMPTLTQPLIPATAAPGGSGFTLTVNGDGFISTSTVDWNGSARTTTFVSSRQLTASILASDIAKAGTARITVATPAPGGGTSNVVYFPITTSTSNLDFSQTTVTTGSNPKEVASGDFNGDGKVDLAVANANSDTVSVFLGNGDGTFGAGTQFVVGTSPRSVAVGDFNDDGKLDLALSNGASNTVSILLGNGDGTFQTHLDFATGTTPTVMALADYNGDGKLDLAVANFKTNNVSVLLGNGDGTLKTHVDYAAGTGCGALATGDFNGDAKLDLACGNFTASTVSILLGNGDGTFQTHVDYGTGVGPSAVITDDFNGDGKLDLAVTDLTANTVSILLGNGNGTFQTHVDYATGTGPQDVAAGDLNGDGTLDLAIADSKGNTFSTLLGNGNGTFQTHVDTSTGTGPDSTAVADFNGDGRLDVAIPNASSNTASIFLQIPGASLTPPSLNFGNVNVGTTSPPQNVTLTNSGSAPLAISNIAITGTNAADFAETNTCPASLAGGAACTVSVTFTPQAAAAFTASLSVTDSAGGSPQTVSLSGTGIGTPVVSLSPASLTFATQLVGTSSASKSVTLTNTGNGTLTITSVTITGADPTDFSQTNTCGSSVAAGASCTINVTFKPKAKNSRTASVSIADNATGSPQTVSLKGTGTVVQVSPTTLNFGSVKVGTSSPPQNVSVKNTGSSSLSITNIGITGTNSGDFSETSTCGASLGAGASCSISVTFAPRAKGNRTASLSITDNGGGSPQTVGLTGTGM